MIHIHKSTVVFFLLLLFSIRWEINDYVGNSITQLAENIARVLAMAYLLLIVQNMKAKKISSRIQKQKEDFPAVFFLCVLMQIWLLLSTVIHHGDLRADIMGYFIPLIIMGLLFESMRSHPEAIIRGGMLVSEVLIYCNLFTIFLFPDGMYSTASELRYVWSSKKNWLLGNRNLFLPYCLFACLTAYLYHRHGGKKWRVCGLYAACLISVILVKSATSTIAMILLLVLLMILQTNKVTFHTYVLPTINILLFFLIVIFRVQSNFPFFKYIFGKDSTFTGRTFLWDTIWPLIGKNLIFGFGITNNGTLQRLTGISIAAHAHNLILDCLYRGGIVYLGLYVIAMILVYRKLRIFQYTKESQAVSIVLFVFQIAALMEPYNRSMFIYAIYFIACSVEYFIPQHQYELNVSGYLKEKKSY